MNIQEQYPQWQGKMRKNCNDLTGQKFGKLTVLYRYYKNNKNGSAQWVCQCDCGVVKVILGASLTRTTKPTRSCGCVTYEHASMANKHDLTGQRFGRLTVLYDSQKRSSHRVIWHCLCDCGNEVDRVSDSLIQGDAISCGHCLASKGSLKIEQLLLNNNIPFEREKTFSDLLGKKNMPLRFDFYLPTYNKLIEYDGIQHFQERNFFRDTLLEIQTRDIRKNEYCQLHKIPLVRIPYWKENVTLEDLLSTKYEVE